ncbi:Chorion peroxidase [Nymphon striatum]|nr:Chorion peroxidase [Nymphon striatum]
MLELRKQLELEMIEFGPMDSETAGEFILNFMQIICRMCDQEDVDLLSTMPLIGDLRTNCPLQVECDETSKKFRNIDGTCNNLFPTRSLEGSADSSYGRFLFPAYQDLISNPRSKGRFGSLKEPRFISDTLFKDFPTLDNRLTTLTVFFGQLLSHDFTLTKSVSVSLDGSTPECCEDPRIARLYSDCIPIQIPPTDSFFPQFGVDCLNLQRSLPTIRRSCTFGFREQENGITHLIDASFLYGSNVDIANSLRSFTDGLMLSDGDGLLPLMVANGCSLQDQNCRFQTGDVRGNQNPPLTFLHTLFLREHNRIATEIKSMMPALEDEDIYQETRKIIIATVESITWRKYLPLILGSEAIISHGLAIGDPDPTLYDKRLVPNVVNGFATAAFRFGHGTVTSNIDLLGRGMTRQCPRMASVKMASSMTRQLYNAAARNPSGQDLASRNIQRGREQGLPPYNKYREFCGFRKI